MSIVTLFTHFFTACFAVGFYILMARHLKKEIKLEIKDFFGIILLALLVFLTMAGRQIDAPLWGIFTTFAVSYFGAGLLDKAKNNLIDK